MLDALRAAGEPADGLTSEPFDVLVIGGGVERSSETEGGRSRRLRLDGEVGQHVRHHLASGRG